MLGLANGFAIGLLKKKRNLITEFIEKKIKFHVNASTKIFVRFFYPS